MKTLVFIPALNEEASIAGVIADVRAHLPQADLLVVDDGSTDQTTRNARSLGVPVALLPFNQGVGAAHQTGFLYALRGGYEICGQLDGDGQHPAAELARLVSEVEKGRADIVVGSRFHDPGVDGSEFRSTFSRRIGQRVFRRMVNASTRQSFTDTTSGMRALNRRAMTLFSERYSPEFAEVESLQRAIRQGLKIEELQVQMLPRTGGESFLTPMRSLYYIFKTMIVLLVGHLRPKNPETH